MIQELFGGGASLVGGERKFSFNGAVLEGSPLSTSNISTTSTTSTTAIPITTTTPPTDQQNLRCPRCDSSNTKFCYYNNYNLTQPRHFCKTCRRYWTKGGALRNVPIGGGCRKNKSSSTSSATTVKSSAGKIKTPEFGKSNFGFELEPPTNQVLWASPQNSQLMALLRAAQNQNPNPNPSSVAIKEEGAMVGSYMSSDSVLGTSALNARPTGVDHVSQVPVGLYNSFWRNNQDQPQTQQHHHNQNQQHQQHSLLMGDVQNSGIQELFNRLRSSGNYYSNHSHPQFSNEASSTSSPSSTVMEPSPITGGEVGYWNPTLSWANLPTANGAFP